MDEWIILRLADLETSRNPDAEYRNIDASDDYCHSPFDPLSLTLVLHYHPHSVDDDLHEKLDLEE